jgi:hypothetical protein
MESSNDWWPMEGSNVWWPLKGSNAWWPMDGEGKTSFSPFLIFPSTNLLKLFFFH